tara:strand:- start:52 stop:1011 length:960 start_codon:yes stop_codon:yes gene_type:complete
MANANITHPGTYAGEAARPYVAAAVLSADTIANGYISVLENVRSKAVLRKFSGTVLAAATCEFTGSGSLTLGEAVLATNSLQVNEQVCNDDLRQTWEAMQMRGQSSAAPADFTTYVAQYVAAKVAEGVEHNIWAGNWKQVLDEDAPYSSFTGIVQNITAGAPDRETVSALPLAAATVASTSVGILDALALVTGGSEGAPSTIAGDPNTKIFMSRASAQFYYTALAATYNLPFLNDGLVARYAGYDIITPGGFPDNVLLISKIDNLYFGTDLLTDHIQASVLDLTGVTGDDVTRVIMKFSGGTQVVDLDGLAIWRTETAS